MMKTRNSPLGFKRTGGALLLMAISSVMFSQTAYANTSAGTVLRNSVTVDYEDANNVAQTQQTASVDVTVDLVPSVAWGAAPANQTVQSAQALPSPYVITLTNLGNGSDAYDITDNTTEACTTGTLAAESFGFTTAVTLGATVSAAAGVFSAPNTTINVSNIVAADFVPGDTVIINSNPYTVVSATADGNGTTTDTLVVLGDATADASAAGVQIGEQIDFEYGATGSAGALSNFPVSGCEHQHELVVDGTLATGGNTQTTATVTGWSTFVEGVALTVEKYVRNATVPAKNPVAADITYNSVPYYLSGVSGNPGNTLEYLVVITNASSGTAQNVVFNDTLPAFTSYTAQTLAVDIDGDEAFEQDTVMDETEADGESGGIITQSGQAIQVFPGVGGDENTNIGGTVSDIATTPNNKTAVKYRITIN